jgi:hypothetical protein
MIQPGVGYTVTTTPDGQQTLQIEGFDSTGGVLQSQKTEQFEIFIQGNQLSVANGTVLWASHNFGPTDDAAASEATCTNQSIVKVYARYTGDSVTVGTDSTGVTMSQDGYVTLSL